MKTYIIAIILFFISCDPPPPFGGPTIEIKAQVINPKDTISLGDSVAFYFEVPDTVNFNGSRIKTYLTNKDGCGIILFPHRIDPATGNIPPDADIGNFIANPGIVKNWGDLNLANVNGKLTGLFFFIPTKKGVYYIEVKQNGFLYINDASIKTTHTFNFGPIDRHFNLVLNNVNPSINLNGFLQDKWNRGLDAYAFYVK